MDGGRSDLGLRGTRTAELVWRPVIGRGMRLLHGVGNAGSPIHLLLRLRLPRAADSSFQGQTTQIVYRFGAAG